MICSSVGFLLYKIRRLDSSSPRTELTAASRRTGGGGVSASTTHIDTYSSDEDEQRKGIIDIDQVSGINDLAPTSVFRDRRTEEEKLAERIARKAKAEEKRRERRSISRRRAEAGAVGDDMVKAEPISPDKVLRDLPVTVVDDDDVEMGDEEDMGKAVRRFARTGGAEAGADEDEEEDEAVKRAKQMVDVDESESEPEDEDLTGDFVDLHPDQVEDENGDKIVSRALSLL